MRGAYAIVGLGLTEQGVRLGIGARELRARAVDLALADAGLERDAIDGYIHAFMEREDLRYMGLSPNFSVAMQTGGATPVFSIISAIGMIASGQAEMVACVYGQAISARDAGQAGYGGYAYGYPSLYGLVGAAGTHAFHARRHMHLYGTTSEHLGAVAVTQRNYAVVRPGALGYGKPITLADHQASPLIADPFRRLDCTRDTDGGCAVLVTTAERARAMGAEAIHVLGCGTGHNIANWHRGEPFANHDNVAPAKARAFAQAGMTLDDIHMAQLYDPFTISPLMQLEAYGVVPEGQGGPFYADGGAGPDGPMPTNTGGGQISAYYTTGFTGVVEAILQLRRQAGAGQLKRADTALVSGHGLNAGVQNTWAHATMILGDQPMSDASDLADIVRRVGGDPLDLPFWEACREGRFLLHRCGVCGAHYWPASRCVVHGDQAMAWTEASGRGEVYTFTNMRHAYTPAMQGRTPYVVAVVKLDEGPFFHSNVVDCPPDAVTVGMPVTAVMAEQGGITLPMFRPL